MAMRLGPVGVLVVVLMEPVVRDELGRVRLTVVVPVVVDEDRRAVVAQQASAERLGQQRWDEHALQEGRRRARNRPSA